MLTEHDIEMLSYIASMEDAPKSDVVQKFGKSGQARLRRLEQSRVIQMTTVLRNGEHVFTGGYSVTSEGYMLLQDHRSSSRKSKNRLWEHRAYQIVPIVISIIALIKSFWPELTEIWQLLRQVLCKL